MQLADNLTDEQLVEKIRQGNNDLFSAIIQRYQTKLTHYLRKFIQNHDELEDVLQEVFIKVYRNINGFDIKRKFSAWIFRIAHNEAVNFFRKNGNHKISLDEVEWELIDEQADTGRAVELRINKEKVEAAMAHLKEKYREPLMLYYFESRTYDEISDIMRLPRNTVGTLINRGKKILKQYLIE